MCVLDRRTAAVNKCNVDMVLSVDMGIFCTQSSVLLPDTTATSQRSGDGASYRPQGKVMFSQVCPQGQGGLPTKGVFAY